MTRYGGRGRLAALVVACAFASGLEAQERPAVEVKVGGSAQFQFSTTSVDLGDDVAGSAWEMRRVRPTIDVTIDEWIEARIQPDVAMGRLRIADAYVNLGFTDALAVQVGQFKKPFSQLELTSSTKLIVIERGLRMRGLTSELSASGLFETIDGALIVPEHYEILEELGYLGRDLGVQIHGGRGRVGYALGLFNGEGSDQIDEHGGKSVAGRLVVTPTESVPFRIGGGLSYREAFDDGDRSSTGTAFEVDAEWGDFRAAGLHVQAELATGDNLGSATDESFLGAQALAAWFFPLAGAKLEGFELDGRVSYGDPRTDVDNDEAWLFTPGAVFYFYGRNRLMLNWDVFVPSADALETRNAFRAQLQVHF